MRDGYKRSAPLQANNVLWTQLFRILRFYVQPQAP
jgi:hypothetical protein